MKPALYKYMVKKKLQTGFFGLWKQCLNLLISAKAHAMFNAQIANKRNCISLQRYVIALGKYSHSIQTNLNIKKFKYLRDVLKKYIHITTHSYNLHTYLNISKDEDILHKVCQFSYHTGWCIRQAYVDALGKLIAKH